MLYWSVGKRVREEVLGGERAEYGQQVIKGLAERLTERYGRGWSRRNLEKMIHLAEWLSDSEKCETLSPKLNWSHFFELLTIPDQRERDFYAAFASHERWSVRTLRTKIASKLYERTIAARGSQTSRNTSRTPTVRVSCRKPQPVRTTYRFKRRALGMALALAHCGRNLHDALQQSLTSEEPVP